MAEPGARHERSAAGGALSALERIATRRAKASARGRATCGTSRRLGSRHGENVSQRGSVPKVGVYLVSRALMGELRSAGATESSKAELPESALARNRHAPKDNARQVDVRDSLRGDPRPWRVHVRVRTRLVILDERSRRVRELPRHGRALRGVDEVESPTGRGLQRLPHAAVVHRQVRDEGVERLLALLLLHDRTIPGSAPHHAAKSRGDGGRVPILPRGDRRVDRARR